MHCISHSRLAVKSWYNKFRLKKLTLMQDAAGRWSRSVPQKSENSKNNMVTSRERSTEWDTGFECKESMKWTGRSRESTIRSRSATLAYIADGFLPPDFTLQTDTRD